VFKKIWAAIKRGFEFIFNGSFLDRGGPITANWPPPPLPVPATRETAPLYTMTMGVQTVEPYPVSVPEVNVPWPYDPDPSGDIIIDTGGDTSQDILLARSPEPNNYLLMFNDWGIKIEENNLIFEYQGREACRIIAPPGEPVEFPPVSPPGTPLSLDRFNDLDLE